MAISFADQGPGMPAGYAIGSFIGTAIAAWLGSSDQEAGFAWAAAVVVSAEVTGGIYPPPGRPNQWTRLVSWRC